MIQYYNRKKQCMETEAVAAGKSIKYLYSTHSGKFLLHTLIKRKFITAVYGLYCDSPLSKPSINKFISKFKMDMSDFQGSVKVYKNFNEFFYRKLKVNARYIPTDPNTLISPCDSKLLCIDNIDDNTCFYVKNSKYHLRDLIKNSSIAEKYVGGCCLIFRLCPTDYHRFHFIDDGICSNSIYIKGSYYSVNPLALENIPNVFLSNKKNYSIFSTKNFDDVIYIEVGATAVGSIIQTYESNTTVKRGDEKGYFKFGGSTVMLFFKKNVIIMDKDITTNSIDGIETKVQMGEKIGCKFKK